MLSFLFTFVLLASTLAAPSTPNLVYSLQAQRPPVARLSKTWNFSLLPGTFNSSSGSTISLSSNNLPRWVTFNAASATFSGMPIAGDEGSFPVTVQANATGVATGTSDTFTLLVVAAAGPIVKLSIAQQIPGASSLGDGAILTPDGALRIPPHWSFSLGFQQYTFFQENYARIYYTAYETGTTQLMPWLIFDNRTVTFDGLAPAAIGEYSVTLYGSDHFGYGDLVQVFKLSVGFHSFELIEVLPSINTTAGNIVDYTIPIEEIKLDNVTAIPSDFQSIQVNLQAFPFLTYTANTRVIAGTIPSTLKPSNSPIPIIFTDLYNDTITTSINFSVITALFTTTMIPTLNVSSGVFFNFDLSRYTSDRMAKYSATISPTAAQNWLNFDSTNLVLSGTPPHPVPSYGNVIVGFTGADPITGVRSSSSLVLEIAATSVTSPVVAPVPVSNSKLSNGGKLALAIVFGLLGLILLIALLYWLFKRYTGEDGLLRKDRRDSSFQIFNETTIATAESKPKSILKGIMIAPKPGGNAGTSDGEKNQEKMAGTQGFDDDAVKSGGPKRFDLLNFLKSSPKKKDTSMISLPISQNSLFGLGTGESTHPSHSIVVVTDGAEDTYDPRDVNSDRFQSNSDLESSSWESQGSSSLFYSESSSGDVVAGNGTVPGRTRKISTPRQRSDFAANPTQRKDFAPSPLAQATHSSPEDSILEGDEEEIEQGGIRLVSLNAGSSGSDSLTSMSEVSEFGGSVPRFIPFTAKVVAPNQSQSDPLSRPISTSLIPQARPSLVPQPRPSLIPQPRPILRPRDSQIQDADEEKRRSVIYSPPSNQEPIQSPIYFNSLPVPYGTQPDLPSPYIFDEAEDRISLIASPQVVSNQHARLLSVQKNRRTAASSMYSNNSAYDEPERISLEVNEFFKFTPALTSPPHVSISAPSRGIPPKASYSAVLDNPSNPAQDRTHLPSWITFNSNSLELSGIPTQTGFTHIIILESKISAPGSPTRKNLQSRLDREPHLPGQGIARKVGETEEIVGRYILEVSQDWVAEDEEKVVIAF